MTKKAAPKKVAAKRKPSMATANMKRKQRILEAAPSAPPPAPTMDDVESFKAHLRANARASSAGLPKDAPDPSAKAEEVKRITPDGKWLITAHQFGGGIRMDRLSDPVVVPQMSHETGPLTDPDRLPPIRASAQAPYIAVGPEGLYRSTEPPLWDFDPKAKESISLGTDPNPNHLGLAMKQVDESLDRLRETINALAATLFPVLAPNPNEYAEPDPILTDCPAVYAALEQRNRADKCIGMLSDIISRLRV